MKALIEHPYKIVTAVFITTLTLSLTSQASLIKPSDVIDQEAINQTVSITTNTIVEKRCLSMLGNKHVQLDRAKKVHPDNLTFSERAFNTRVGRLSKYNENINQLNCNEKS